MYIGNVQNNSGMDKDEQESLLAGDLLLVSSYAIFCSKAKNDEVEIQAKKYFQMLKKNLAPQN